MKPADFFHRHQPRMSWQRITLASLGSAITVAVLASVGDITQLLLIIAPFGPSCLLVFLLPDASLSQPLNVIVGHVTASVLGVLFAFLLPAAWWSIALAVGASIALMAALRITHPPAAGNPIAIILTGAGWDYVLTPALLGSVIIVTIGVIFHRMSHTPYPIHRVPPSQNHDRS